MHLTFVGDSPVAPDGTTGGRGVSLPPVVRRFQHQSAVRVPDPPLSVRVPPPQWWNRFRLLPPVLAWQRRQGASAGAVPE